MTARVRLTRAQQEFRRAEALYRGFVGGRGAGKSWVGAYDLLRRAKPGRTYLVGSPTGVKLMDETFPTLKAIAQQLGRWGHVRLSPYPTVELTTGATIRFRSGEDPEKWRGPNLSGLWMDEASLMHVECFNVGIACLREGGEQGWLSASFTPKGISHWTYDVFGGGRPDTVIVHSRTGDNPFLPPGFEGTLANQYTPQRQRQELGGEFVSMEGAEWPAEYFPPSVVLPPARWPTSWRCSALALDPAMGQGEHGKPPPSNRTPEPGCYAAFAFAGVDHAGVLWVDAWMSQSWDAAALVNTGMDLLQRTGAQALAVETNGGQKFLCELFQARARELRRTLPMYGINNVEDKEVRIRSTLTPFLAQGRLRFNSESEGAKLLVGQMRDFPVGKYRDGCDALQMAVVMCDWLLGHKPGGAQPRAMG